MEDLVFPKPDGSVAIPLDLEFPTPGSNATCPCIIVDENRNEPLDWRCARGFQAPAQHSTLDWTGFAGAREGRGGEGCFFLTARRAELPVSACAQFGEYGMLDVAARVKAMGVSTAVLLDLRQEAHGYLRIGGSPHTFTEAAPEEVVWRDDTLLPVSWFTSDGNWAQVGMTDKEAARWEASLLGVLRRQRHVTLAWPNHRCVAARAIHTFLSAHASCEVSAPLPRSHSSKPWARRTWPRAMASTMSAFSSPTTARHESRWWTSLWAWSSRFAARPRRFTFMCTGTCGMSQRVVSPPPPPPQPSQPWRQWALHHNHRVS